MIPETKLKSSPSLKISVTRPRRITIRRDVILSNQTKNWNLLCIFLGSVPIMVIIIKHIEIIFEERNFIFHHFPMGKKCYKMLLGDNKPFWWSFHSISWKVSNHLNIQWVNWVERVLKRDYKCWSVYLLVFFWFINYKLTYKVVNKSVNKILKAT